MTAMLLIIAIALIVNTYLAFLSYIDAKRRHNDLIDLLNDLATMLGELFEHKE